MGVRACSSDLGLWLFAGVAFQRCVDHSSGLAEDGASRFATEFRAGVFGVGSLSPKPI